MRYTIKMTKSHNGCSENGVNTLKYGFLHLSPRLLERMKKFEYMKFITNYLRITLFIKHIFILFGTSTKMMF